MKKKINNLKRKFISIVFFVNALTFSIVCQGQDVISTNKEVQKNQQTCLPNSDSLYDRQKVLEELASTLNSSIPEYKEFYGWTFSVKNENSIGFIVFDLVDTSNKDFGNSKCVNFINGHIYHVVPLRYGFSFSHIVILEDQKLKVFRSINCQGRGDTLNDVLKYLAEKLKENNKKDEIIERVKNYRNYGGYFRSCEFEDLRCEEIKN